MAYVMVPVPEEHVQSVMEFVIRTLNRAALEDWDQEALESLFHEVDEPSRSLLSVVARATLSNKDLSESDAAAAMQLNVRETSGIMRELNERAREVERPPLVSPRSVTEALPNGRTRNKRILTMAAEIAAMVRELERAEHASLTQSMQEDT